MPPQRKQVPPGPVGFPLCTDVMNRPVPAQGPHLVAVVVVASIFFPPPIMKGFYPTMP